MSKFKQLVKNKLEDDRGLATAIAAKMGFKSPTSLYKFLNEEDRELESFDGLLTLVSELFPGEEKEVLCKYLPTLDPNKKAARCALEYANVNNYSDLEDKLIESLNNASNKESKEWSVVYALHRKNSSMSVTAEEAEDEVMDLNLKFYETKLFCKISILYKFLGIRDFNSLDRSVRLINKKGFDKITDEYIMNSYQCRTWMISANSCLSQNNPEEARKNAKLAEENSSSMRFKAFGNLIQGNSYIFTNYELAKKHLLKGIEVSNGNIGYITQINRSLCFLENYYGNENPYLNLESDAVEDLHEIAFSLIRFNEFQKALEILNKVGQNSLTKNQMSYHLFFRGLISNDQETYLNSLDSFKETGERYFIQVVLFELRKLGVSERLIQSLTL